MTGGVPRTTEERTCGARPDHVSDGVWESRPLTCRAPAVTSLEAICVHEHRRLVLTCRDHAVNDLAREQGTYCIECHEHDGHLCQLRIRELPLDAPLKADSRTTEERTQR